MPLTQQEASYIFDQTVGCRYGTTIDGAAYGFMDIVGAGQDGDGSHQDPTPQQVLAWLQNPQAPEFQPRWDQRLYNTCGLSPAGTVLLVSKAQPTAERYHVQGGLGDGYTFRKVNRLPPDAQILATIHYGAGDAVPESEDAGSGPAADVAEGEVDELVGAVMQELGKLAG
jgi:hypothetical protein